MKTGIQDAKERNWIPACAGMTGKEREWVTSTSSRQYVEEPLAFKARVVQSNMKTYRIRWDLIIGALFALIFLFLLTLRLGIFRRSETDHRGDHTFNAQTRMDREIWMNILQEGQKIGYVHRQFFKTVEGYNVLESVFIQVNVMGMVQDIRYKTEGNFQHDLNLSSFNFDLKSSLFHFKVRGVVKDKNLTLFTPLESPAACSGDDKNEATISNRKGGVKAPSFLTGFTGSPGSEQRLDLPLEKDINLPIGILEMLNAENLKAGETITFHVFDPATMAERPFKVLALTEETIPIMGRQEKAKKVSIDFMGVPQFAWIGKDGAVLKEEGSFGIRLEQVAKEEALKKIALFPGTDLAEVASIPANKVIHDVGQLKELKLRLDGIEEGGFFLNGDRQSLKNKILTIQRESISRLPPRWQEVKVFEDGKTYLEASPFIQFDHPEIQARAKEIVSSDDPDIIRADKLIQWVNQNIKKRPVLSVPNALETLRNRVGDCNEHAVLLAGLAQASGIPAQVEAGLVYQRGRFYYHAWNVLYLGTWITADSVMGQFPADVTHIRFIRGAERQIDLMGLIGRVNLEILSAS